MQRGDVAWQVIESIRRQGLTCELTLHLDGLGDASPVRVYLRDGVVYFAERSSDPSLGVRLIAHGVVSREQLHRGALVVNGIEHLGRLFEREPSVDRGAVELCAEMLTDAVLTEVAGLQVQRHDIAVYRRHPAGVDRWMAERAVVPVPVAAVVAERPVDDLAVVAPAAERPPAPAATHVSMVEAPPVADATPVADSLPATFADEVAVAVRAVLEAIDVAATPAPRYVPEEFTWSATP